MVLPVSCVNKGGSDGAYGAPVGKSALHPDRSTGLCSIWATARSVAVVVVVTVPTPRRVLHSTDAAPNGEVAVLLYADMHSILMF